MSNNSGYTTLHLSTKTPGSAFKSGSLISGPLEGGIVVTIQTIWSVGESIIAITGFGISGPLSTSTPGSYFDSGGLKTGPLEGGVVVNSGKTISEERKSVMNGSNFSNGCSLSLGRGGLFFSRPLANSLDTSVGIRSSGTRVTSDTSSQVKTIVSTVEAIVTIRIVTVESISGFGLSLSIS